MSELSSHMLHRIADALVDVTDEYCDSKWEETIADWERIDAARALLDRLESHGLTITPIAPRAEQIGDQKVLEAVRYSAPQSSRDRGALQFADIGADLRLRASRPCGDLL